MVEIGRGNTQKGVHSAVIRYLRKHVPDLESLFDAPCGAGELLRSLQLFYPRVRTLGQDLYAEVLPEIRPHVVRADVSQEWYRLQQEKFDVITCISGVMVFDDITGFFRKAAEHLKPGGLLIVTNDNVLSIRDRLSFFFLGRLRRFRLLYAANEGLWNVVLIQGLWKLFSSNQFTVRHVEYTSMRVGDWLFLPLAVALYPIFAAYLVSLPSPLSLKERFRLFPFNSLLCRHYIIVGEKTGSESSSKRVAALEPNGDVGASERLRQGEDFAIRQVWGIRNARQH